MDFFQSLTAARVIFILGILNFVLVVLLLSSCRCILGSRIGGRLMKRRFYKRLSAKHCYLWYILCPSVVVHAFFAIMFMGWPG
ncbi:MAG: hypothetical protein WC455_07915 [Dehalococcoidia bacterium]|jgi:hypothetical protein